MGSVKKERKLVTPSEFSEFLGVSKRAVLDAIKTKRLDKSVNTEANGYNKLDAIKAAFEWFENGNLAQDHEGRLDKDEPKNRDEGISYREAQRIREEYRAYITKLEYEEKRSSLVPKDAANKLIFERARTFRDRLLAIAEKLSPRLAHQESSAIRILLLSELEKTLLSLTEGGECD